MRSKTSMAETRLIVNDRLDDVFQLQTLGRARIEDAAEDRPGNSRAEFEILTADRFRNLPAVDEALGPVGAAPADVELTVRNGQRVNGIRNVGATSTRVSPWSLIGDASRCSRVLRSIVAYSAPAPK